MLLKESWYMLYILYLITTCRPGALHELGQGLRCFVDYQASCPVKVPVNYLEKLRM